MPENIDRWNQPVNCVFHMIVIFKNDIWRAALMIHFETTQLHSQSLTKKNETEIAE